MKGQNKDFLERKFIKSKLFKEFFLQRWTFVFRKRRRHLWFKFIGWLWVLVGVTVMSQGNARISSNCVRIQSKYSFCFKNARLKESPFLKSPPRALTSTDRTLNLNVERFVDFVWLVCLIDMFDRYLCSAFYLWFLLRLTSSES